MRKHRIFILAALLIAGFHHGRLQGQEKPQITVDWIYSDASAELTALPRFFWLRDNTAILFDLRKPKAERTFELFAPESGKRRSLVDRDLAVQSLKTALGKEDTTVYLSWPRSFDRDGKRAVYLFNGDIYLLDLAASRFQRITKTDEKEKSVNFSPDGQKLAFVRANDLYVYDIAHHAEKRLTRDGSETLLNGTLSWVYWEEIFGRRDIGYWWSEDSRSIAYLQTDESMVSVMHFVDYKPQV
ncbi:MAG: hypothetical protein D6743_00325, partial [Calditrichaeota bacterium]